MLLRTSRTSSPFMLIGIVLLIVALFIPSFIHTGNYFDPLREGVLFSSLHTVSQHYVFSPLLAMLSVVLIVLLIGRISQKYILLTSRNYLSGILFVVLCSSIDEIKIFNPVYPATLLILLALGRFIDSYRKEGDSKEYFEGSLYIGLAGLFYPPSVMYIITAWFALLLFRSFRWREWVFSLLGLSVPYLFLISYYFLAGENISNGTKPFLAYFSLADRTLHLPQLIYIGFALLLILIASTYSNRRLNAQKVQTGKSYTLFFLMLLLTVGIFLLLPGIGKEIIIIGCIPIAFLLALYFTEVKKNWLIEILFDLIVLGSIVLSYLPQ